MNRSVRLAGVAVIAAISGLVVTSVPAFGAAKAGQLCAKADENKKDGALTCSKDSGGKLRWANGSGGSTSGIVKKGQFCDKASTGKTGKDAAGTKLTCKLKSGATTPQWTA